MKKTKEIKMKEKIKVEETYRLNDCSDLFEILKKIEKTDDASFDLGTEGIRLQGSLVTIGGIEHCFCDIARIVNGEYIGKDDKHLYLQIYNEDDVERAELSEDESLRETRPDYLDILREFIG